MAAAAWADVWPGVASIFEAFAPTRAQFDVLLRDCQPVKLVFELGRETGGSAAPVAAALRTAGYDTSVLAAGIAARRSAAPHPIRVWVDADTLVAHVYLAPDALTVDDLLTVFETMIGDPAISDCVRRGALAYVGLGTKGLIGARAVVGEPAVGRVRFHHADDDDIDARLIALGFVDTAYQLGTPCAWLDQEFELPVGYDEDLVVYRRRGVLIMGGRTRSIYVPARANAHVYGAPLAPQLQRLDAR